MTVARIGVPAAVLMALGGYFGWSNLNQPANVPIVAGIQQAQVVPAPLPERAPVAPDRLVASRNPEKNINQMPGGPEVRPPSNVKPSDEQGVGSLDFSLPTARRRLPRGLDPDRLITNANISSNTRQSAVEVLRMLGVAASCSASGCSVGSVSANSVAYNSGLRAGDVIEAIDGQPLRSGTTFAGEFSAATIRVRRGGSAISIALRP
jgi:hypothetical protein